MKTHKPRVMIMVPVRNYPAIIVVMEILQDTDFRIRKE